MFEPEGFSKTIFKDRYAFTEDETWQEACDRVAKQMALVENPEKIEKYHNKFYEILITNQFCPGGRIWYGSGRPNPQLLNCFILRSELDSKEGWAGLIYDNIVTSMSGGGCGQDFSDIRPNGAPIRGHRGTCPGPLGLMKGVNETARMVRAGGGRRAANMFSLNLHHPDIEKFLDMKFGPKSSVDDLSMANISVRSLHTTKFIEAIKSDGDWELSWKGQYKSKIKAKKIWETIYKNAYECADPGFLNMELALSESTIYYIADLVTTNPCGEIFLTPYGCCDLGHLVLTRFIKDSEIDWSLLGDVIRLAVRFLDNVLDINNYPLPQMKAEAQKYRRIGLGTTGLADMLAILGYRYGSKEANKFIDKLFRFISKAAYEASVMLAIEKGQFSLCKPEMHVKSGYMSRMTNKIKSLVLEHGIRNCAVLTQAPVGTGSLLSGNCSSGIEPPPAAAAWWRYYWKGEKREKELIFHPLFVQLMEKGKDVSHLVGAHDLTVEEHMEVQKIVQKHIDNAVSKTINIPHDCDVDKLGKIWLKYLPHLKGTTFYREGAKENAPLQPIGLEEAIKIYNEHNGMKKQEVMVTDCPKGVCDI